MRNIPENSNSLIKIHLTTIANYEIISNVRKIRPSDKQPFFVASIMSSFVSS